MLEVPWRSTWLAGLAIPNFTLAHPKYSSPLCRHAGSRSPPAWPTTRLKGLVRRKAFAPVILRRLLRFWGCSHPRPHEFRNVPDTAVIARACRLRQAALRPRRRHRGLRAYALILPRPVGKVGCYWCGPGTLGMVSVLLPLQRASSARSRDLSLRFPAGRGNRAERTGPCYIGRQGHFAGSLARASRTELELVKTPKMPSSTVTM